MWKSRGSRIAAKYRVVLAWVGFLFIGVPQDCSASRPHLRVEDPQAELAAAEQSLAGNDYAAAMAALDRLRADDSLPDSVRARVERDRALTHFARWDWDASLEAGLDAVLLAPQDPLSPPLLMHAKASTSPSGDVEIWASRLKKLEAAARQCPALRVPLCRSRMQLALMRGDAKAARRMADEAGVVRDFLVTGPFANAGGSGIEAIYPPELGFAPSDTYTDRRGRQVSWYPALSLLDGTVDLDACFDDEADAVAYLANQLWSDVARGARLHIEGGGAARVWLNGELVLDEFQERRSAELIAPIDLQAGWNQLLIKRAAQRLPLYNRCLLSGEDGAPLVLRAEAVPDAQPGYAAVRYAPVPRGLARRPEDSLLRKVDQVAAEGELAAVHAVSLELLAGGFLDEAERFLARCSERWPGCGLLLMHRAKLESTRDSGLSDGYWREAARCAPQFFAAQLAVISSGVKGTGLEANLAEIDAMAVAFADGPTAWIWRYYADRARGDFSRALQELEGERRRHPRELMALEMRLQTLQLMGDVNAYGRALAEAVQARPDQVDFQRSLAAYHFHRGEYDEAAERLRVALAVGAPPRLIYDELISVQERAGNSAAVLDAAEAGMRWSPLSVRFPHVVAMTCLREGDKARALDYLARAIALGPQNTELRSLQRRVEGRPSLEAAFPRANLDSLRQHANLSWLEGKPDLVYLLHEEEMLVYPDGVAETRLHYVAKVLNEAGAERARKLPVADWSAVGEKLEVSRLYKPDGRTIEAERGDGEVAFSDVEIGDVVEIQQSSAWSPASGLGNSTWWDSELQFHDPCCLVRFSVIHPDSMGFVAAVHNMADCEKTWPLPENWRLRSWAIRQQAAYEEEPDGITQRARTAWVDISNVADWPEMARWFQGSFRGPSRVTPAVRSLADSLVAGANGDSARVARCAEFVRREVAYEGGQFVSWGTTPRAAELVLRTRFGDCKDKTALLVALLSAIGIEARPALLHTTQGARFAFLPSTRFDHAIVQAVTADGRVWWIDPTEEHLSLANVPAGLEGARAFLVDASHAEPLVSIGVDPPATNGHRIETRATLDAQNRMQLAGTIRWHGEDASAFRFLQAYLAGDFDRQMRDWLGGLVVGAAIDSLVWPEGQPGGDGIEVGFALSCAPEFNRAGDLRLLKLPWLQRVLTETEVAAETRRGPLVLGSMKGVYEEESELALPAGMHLETEPGVSVHSCPNGSYRLERRLVGGRTLRVSRRLEISGLEVAAEDYPAFRAFVHDIVASDAEPLVFRVE